MSTDANSTGKCPHCRTGVRFEAPSVAIPGRPVGSATPTLFIKSEHDRAIDLSLSSCPECGKLILAITQFRDQGATRPGTGVVYPAGATRPLPSEALIAAPSLADDFAEAVAVLAVSRKASAALSRRCLQFILVNAGGATKRDLAEQIDEVLPKLPPDLAVNVDAIRHVGNFAAHPLKSKQSGDIVEVEEGEAEWLLDVLEELIDFYYVAPAQQQSKRDALNKKLKALGKPPLKQPPAPTTAAPSTS